MPSIYLTTNLYNKQNGILPFQYIGSDQKDKNNYFGSSKKLKEDLKRLGAENFEKKILVKFVKIDNVGLREVESSLQQSLDCAGDETYYNLTNTGYKGVESHILSKKIKESKQKRSKEDKEETYKKLKTTLSKRDKKDWKEIRKRQIKTLSVKSEEAKQQSVIKRKLTFQQRTDEERNATRLKTKNSIENRTREEREKVFKNISQASLKRTKGKVFVYKYPSLEFVGEYYNAATAARELNIYSTYINKILRGKSKSIKGYTFKRIK